ncbi:hypothetical protein SAMN05877838_2901 [Hoeflea halophila]|uniref:Uncharacterized protein n=1 Tax=Hoeflea halophila TaxID=714899 RepID=A0A286ICX9_9HYPH|nr:hypothetical protein SAMN05877838_2901 [Hoeflea halophila]
MGDLNGCEPVGYVASITVSTINPLVETVTPRIWLVDPAI